MNTSVWWQLQLASTLYMTGLIWFVQLVHYPLLARVGRDGFAAYARAHQQRTTWVVVGPMLLEVASAAVLLVQQAALRQSPAFLVAVGLLAAIWLSTFAMQVPLHQELARGQDERRIAQLVASNWVRTVAWSLRAVLLLLLAG